MTDTGILDNGDFLPIRPLCFLENPGIIEGSDEIIVYRPLFEKWLDLFAPSIPIIVRLFNVDTDKERHVCVSGYCVEEAIYAPNWILENLGAFLEEDNYVYITPHTHEIETATKLYIKPMEDSMDADIREAVETYIDRFHVLEPGTTLTVPVGEFEIPMYVERTEPAPLVKLGGEVIVEFLEEPKETEPKETEPKETEPKETEPKETEPKETEPKETEPKTATGSVVVVAPVIENVVVKALTPEEVRQKRLEHFAKLTNKGL